MATSHKLPAAHHFRSFLHFCLAYFPVSFFMTIALIVLAYKDLVYLRFSSGFVSSTPQTAGTNQLVIDGLSNNMLSRLFEYLPLIAVFLLIVVVSYSVYDSYKGVYHGINISKNYINGTRASSAQIMLQYVVLSTVAFTMPVLFWCFFLTAWFPLIAKLPLRYIVGASPMKLLLISVFSFILLLVLTHVGVALTRLAIRLFKYE